jgi:tetratricopeptide (TPR) repeat protein
MKLVNILHACVLLVFLSFQAMADSDFEQCSNNDATDADKKLAACTAAIEKGQLDKTNLAAAYNRRAIVRESKKDMAGAIADYSAVIKIDPKLASAYLSRGDIQYGEKNFKAAIADYSMAVKIRPDWLMALKYLGDAYDESGEPRKAITYYQRAVRIDRKFSDAHFDLGIVYRKIGDYRLQQGDRARSRPCWRLQRTLCGPGAEREPQERAAGLQQGARPELAHLRLLGGEGHRSAPHEEPAACDERLCAGRHAGCGQCQRALWARAGAACGW